jgi:hypothetical protein
LCGENFIKNKNMTQQETEYYNNLKANRNLNDYVFDELFTVINGTTVAKPNVGFKLMADGIPFVYNTFTDQDVFRSLFPDTTAPGYRSLESIRLDPLTRRTPLSYSPLSKNGDDVRDQFFFSAKTYPYSNLQVVVDPSSDIDPKDKITPIATGFYYDKNNNNKQDKDEPDVINVKLFISKITDDLKDIYNDPTVKPAPKEILFFLEDNDGDIFSGTTLYIKKGSKVNATLTNLLANSNTFTSYIKSNYNISLSDLQELIKTGEVKSNIKNLIFTMVEIASFFVTNPLVYAAIATSIKTVIESIKKEAIIADHKWNPKKAAQGKAFEPLLFPDSNAALNKMDDKAMNAFVKQGIQNLRNEIKGYDTTIENVLRGVSLIPISAVFPISIAPTKLPDAFGTLFFAKYQDLRKIMDVMLLELEKFDFSDMLTDGVNAVNAFICGVWNGFVEAICGIISLLQYLFEGAEFFTDLLKNFKEKGPAILEQMDDIIFHFKNLDFNKIFLKLATSIKNWVLADSTVTLVEVAYFSGMFVGIVVELAVEIVAGILFTGGTLSVEAVLAKLGETFKALGKLLVAAIALPGKVFQKTITAFMAALKSLIEFLEKGTDEILRIIDEVFVKLKDLGTALTKTIIKERGLDKPFFSSITEIVSKGIVYGQSKYYTCVATSLRMALESKGIQYSEEYLARALGTSEEGARILDIPEALYAIRQEKNVVTKTYKKIKLDKLVELLKNGDSAIVSVGDDIRGSHAIIVDAIENGKVIIRDPLPINSGSSYSIDILEFDKFFKEKAIIIKK